MRGLFFSKQISNFFKLGSSGNSKNFTGVDIGSFFVKAVSVEKDKQQCIITGFNRRKIQSDVSKAVKEAITALPANKKEISLSLSGNGVILRYVTLPLMNKAELRKSMAFEVEKHIPFPLPEIYFDFSILKENKEAGKMLVVIAAAKKALVDGRIKLCKQLGYQMSFIDVDSLALSNYFEKVNQQKTGVCAIINIGANFTLLDIVEDGMLVLSRDINMGGNDFTKMLAERLNKNIQEAEEMKCAGLKQDFIPIVETVFNNLINGLKVSFDFYECSANRVIDKIFLTGGSCRMTGLADFLKRSLGQEINYINIDQNIFGMKESLNKDEFKKEIDFFPVALGLAIR